MKDSGIEWIGEIPEDWEVVQVKHLFEIGRGRVISKEELKFDSQTGYPVYSSQTKNDGVLGFIGTYDFDQPQLTWTTDGANAGTVFLRKGKYNCTNVCGTLKLKSDIQDKISLDYVYHALYVGAPYYKRKDTNGYKIMNNEMAVIKISLPSFDIQKKISKEIEGKIKTINNLIIKTEQSIEELKKYKQSLITEAVTKGLDPNVEMKDSGIEWVGEIPIQWKNLRFGRIISINSELVNPSNYRELPQVSPDDIEQNGGKLFKFKTVKQSGVSSNNYYFFKNQILYSKIRPKLNKVAIAPFDGLCSADMYPIETSENVNFITYLMMSHSFLHQVSYLTADRVKMPKINRKELSSILIVLPSIEEQRQIVSYLDEQTSRIDKLIADKTKVIEELEDYKKSLIYEYVTGKKEV